MKNYQNFITEVNKHRDDKLMYQYGERNKPENYLPKDPVKDALKNKKLAQGETLKRGNTYLSQIAPMKTTVLGSDLQSLPHVDTRGPGEKLMSIMRQKAYMDDTGRRPPKIP